MLPKRSEILPHTNVSSGVEDAVAVFTLFIEFNA